METPYLRVMRELLLLRVLSSWRVPRGTPRRWAGWRVERGWFAQVRTQFHVEHADAMGVLKCAASKRSTWNVGGRSGTPTRRLSVPQFWVAPHHVFHVERGRGSSKRAKLGGPPLLGLPVHGCVGRLARARSTLLVPRGTRTCGVHPCVCAVHRQFHVERGHCSGANSLVIEDLGHVAGSVVRVPRGTRRPAIPGVGQRRCAAAFASLHGPDGSALRTSSSSTAWWRSREFANACSTWNEEAAHEVLLRGGWRPPLGLRASRGR